MTIQRITVDVNKFDSRLQAKITEAKPKKRFKFIIDQEHDNRSKQIESLFSLRSNLDAFSFPEDCKKAVNTKTLNWNTLENTLVTLSLCIEKSRKISHKIQFLFDSGDFGILRITASKDLSGIYIYLNGSSRLKKKISEKLSCLNKNLSNVIKTPIRIMCYEEKENIGVNDLNANHGFEDHANE